MCQDFCRNARCSICNPILIVMTGDSKIDNKKFKDYFNTKAKMIPPEQVLEMTGHPVGGVCPFAAKERLFTFCRELKRLFSTNMRTTPAVPSGLSVMERSPLSRKVYISF